jgi:hypothetical protein
MLRYSYISYLVNVYPTAVYPVNIIQPALNLCRLHINNIYRRFFLLCGEGSRRIYYGRTAALRLIVQPYDEDE